MKFDADIDIDFADRQSILQHIEYTSAAVVQNGVRRPHNTGIYVTNVPVDPINQVCGLDYELAEQRGYIKLDFLNVNVYKEVKDEEHLVMLMQEPDWTKLDDRNFVEQLIHIKNHYDALHSMPEPVNSIPRLAMFLAVIRPAKRHLIGKTWLEVAQTIWDSDPAGGYQFKKSHAVSYAHLVVVHINLLGHSANKSN